MPKNLPRYSDEAYAIAKAFVKEHDLDADTFHTLSGFRSSLDVAEVFFALGYDLRHDAGADDQP